MNPLDAVSRIMTGRAAEVVEADPRAATFARGLAIGALVGAAIAGSTLWQRRHLRQAAAERAHPAEPPATPEP